MCSGHQTLGATNLIAAIPDQRRAARSQIQARTNVKLSATPSRAEYPSQGLGMEQHSMLTSSIREMAVPCSTYSYNVKLMHLGFQVLGHRISSHGDCSTST